MSEVILERVRKEARCPQCNNVMQWDEGEPQYVVELRTQLAAAQAEIAELKAQLAECQKDAERYRWLRDAGATFYTGENKHHVCELAMDAAIDGAIKAEGRKE